MLVNNIKLKNKGFTLVELLIATSIFSVILLVITYGIVNIGKTYYKGVNSSKTQSVARAISDEISQAIQFSGDTIRPSNGSSPGFFCIGDKKYSYVLNKKVGSEVGQVNHALISSMDSLCTDSAATAALNGALNPADNLETGIGNYKDLLSKPFRLADLSVLQVGSSSNYEVHVLVVSGDDDLIDYSSGVARCRDGVGNQYCAVSDLYTVVNKRL